MGAYEGKGIVYGGAMEVVDCGKFLATPAKKSFFLPDNNASVISSQRNFLWELMSGVYLKLRCKRRLKSGKKNVLG